MRYNTDLEKYREDREEHRKKVYQAVRDSILDDIKNKIKYYKFTIDEVFNNKV